MAAFTSLMIGMAVAGTVANSVGQWKAGSAAKKAGEAGQRAAESEAALDEYNAAVADLQAKDAIERGAEDESRYRSEVRGAIGEQRVGYAAGGVDVNSGSALELQQDSARIGEHDALTIRLNAAMEAWGINQEATDLRQRAGIRRMEGAQLAATGRAQQTAARIGAVAGAATGGADILYRTRKPPAPKK